MTSEVVAAYSETGSAWQRGPGRIYDRLAEVTIGEALLPLDGLRVLDAGAGTGAATRAAIAAGASQVVAADAAPGMLAHDAANRPPAAVGDLLAQPFAADSFDASIAAFSLNHLSDPASGLRELARVTRSGGLLLGSAYAADDTHPVKDAVESALRERGWAPADWHVSIKSDAIPHLATADRCSATLAAAGLDGHVTALRVPFDDLTPEDLVAWRLGMAQHAPFFRSLADDEQHRVVSEALAGLVGSAPLERSILVFQAVNP